MADAFPEGSSLPKVAGFKKTNSDLIHFSDRTLIDLQLKTGIPLPPTSPKNIRLREAVIPALIEKQKRHQELQNAQIFRARQQEEQLARTGTAGPGRASVPSAGLPPFEIRRQGALEFLGEVFDIPVAAGAKVLDILAYKLQPPAGLPSLAGFPERPRIPKPKAGERIRVEKTGEFGNSFLVVESPLFDAAPIAGGELGAFGTLAALGLEGLEFFTPQGIARKFSLLTKVEKAAALLPSRYINLARKEYGGTAGFRKLLNATIDSDDTAEIVIRKMKNLKTKDGTANLYKQYVDKGFWFNAKDKARIARVSKGLNKKEFTEKAVGESWIDNSTASFISAENKLATTKGAKGRVLARDIIEGTPAIQSSKAELIASKELKQASTKHKATPAQVKQQAKTVTGTASTKNLTAEETERVIRGLELEAAKGDAKTAARFATERAIRTRSVDSKTLKSIMPPDKTINSLSTDEFNAITTKINSGDIPSTPGRIVDTTGVKIVVQSPSEIARSVLPSGAWQNIPEVTKNVIAKSETPEHVFSTIRRDMGFAGDPSKDYFHIVWDKNSITAVDRARLDKMTNRALTEEATGGVFAEGKPVFNFDEISIIDEVDFEKSLSATASKASPTVWRRILQSNPEAAYQYDRLIRAKKPNEASEFILRTPEARNFFSQPRITAKELKSLLATVKKKGISEQQLKKYAFESFEDVEHLRDLTIQQAKALRDVAFENAVVVNGKVSFPKSKALLTNAMAKQVVKKGFIGEDAKSIFDVAGPLERRFQAYGLHDEIFLPSLEAVERAEAGQAAKLFELSELRNTVKHIPNEEKLLFDMLDGNTDHIDKFTLVELQPVATALRKMFDDYAIELGLAPERMVTDYAPHIVDWAKTGKIPPGAPEELKKVLSFINKETIYNRFMISRVENDMRITKDIWKAAVLYSARAEDSLAFNPVLKKVSDMKKARVFTADAQHFVTEYMNRVTGRRTGTSFIDLLNKDVQRMGNALGIKVGARVAEELESKALRQIYRGTLGASPGSAGKNLTQGFMTAAELGPLYWAKGVAELLTHAGRKLFDATGLTRTNILNEAFVNLTGEKNTLDRMLFYFFERAEYFNRGVAYLGSRRQLLDYGVRMGMPLDFRLVEDAGKYGKDIVRRTQFMYGPAFTPAFIQHKGTKLLTQFLTFPVNWTAQVWNQTRQAYLDTASTLKRGIPTGDDVLIKQLRRTGLTQEKAGNYKMPRKIVDGKSTVDDLGFWRTYVKGPKKAQELGDAAVTTSERARNLWESVKKPVTFVALGVGANIAAKAIDPRISIEGFSPFTILPVSKDRKTGKRGLRVPPAVDAAVDLVTFIGSLLPGEEAFREEAQRNLRDDIPIVAIPGGRFFDKAISEFATLSRGGQESFLDATPGDVTQTFRKTGIGDTFKGQRTARDTIFNLLDIRVDRGFDEKPSGIRPAESIIKRDKRRWENAAITGDTKTALALEKKHPEFGDHTRLTNDRTEEIWSRNQKSDQSAFTRAALGDILTNRGKKLQVLRDSFVKDANKNYVNSPKHKPFKLDHGLYVKTFKAEVQKWERMIGPGKKKQAKKILAMGKFAEIYEGKWFNQDDGITWGQKNKELFLEARGIELEQKVAP